MAGPTEKVDISHDPDMYIVADAGTERLYVNSAILTAASKVFRIMFGPKSAERISLKNSAKMHEQRFPGDDEEATLVVMAMLHYNTSLVPNPLDDDSVFSLAKFAHKYSLVDAVSPMIYARWIHKYNGFSKSPLSTAESCLVSELLATAYLLRLPPDFERLSNALILNSPGLRKTELSKDALGHLPFYLPDLLDDAQMDMRSKIALLSGERATRIDGYLDYPGDGHWSDRNFFLCSDGKTHKTIRRQLNDMEEMGLVLDGKIEGWFKQGLTYDVAQAITITWNGNLGEDL